MGLAGRPLFVTSVRTVFIKAAVLLVITIRANSFGRDHDRVILRGEFCYQGVHVVIYPSGQVVRDNRGHGDQYNVEVKVGIAVEEVAEDTRECAP